MVPGEAGNRARPGSPDLRCSAPVFRRCSGCRRAEWLPGAAVKCPGSGGAKATPRAWERCSRIENERRLTRCQAREGAGGGHLSGRRVAPYIQVASRFSTTVVDNSLS